MHVDVNEPVEVVAVFKTNRVVPIEVKWNNIVYKITQIDLLHTIYDGSTPIHYFSVTDSENHFRLAFNAKNLKWTLEQAYYPG